MFTSIEGNSTNDVFYELVKKVYLEPDFQSQPRGLSTKECLNVIVNIKNPRNRLVGFYERKLSLKYLSGEYLWYLSGSNKISDINPYSKFWDNIKNKDGSVNSAYGQYLFRKLSFLEENGTQWENVLNLLLHDSDSRRAILLILTPSHTLDKFSKDVPCTISIQVSIRKDKLHMTTYMRSNDLIYGFCYDVPIFTLFQEMLLVELQKRGLNIKMGEYTHFTYSMHIYQRHYKMASRILKEPEKFRNVVMPIMDHKFISEIDIILRAEKELISGSKNNNNLAVNSELGKWLLNNIKNKL